MPALKTETISIHSPQEILATHLQVGEWLNLEEAPSEYADHEALLLTPISDHEWLTWVPGHGEYVLKLVGI